HPAARGQTASAEPTPTPANAPVHPPIINMAPDPPSAVALVGRATWAWVNRDDVGTLPASASQGVVAVSGAVTADHITVDPGDGTGTFTCPGSGMPWQPGATQTNCSHIYPRSSAGKGKNNNFVVTVTVWWAG